MGLPATMLHQLPQVTDPGLDENAKKLTRERIAEVINRVIDRETAARFRVYQNTCVHCGLCSDACHWFLSNDRDPRFSPGGKGKQTLWDIMKRKGARLLTQGAKRVHPAENRVELGDGTSINYDYLVIATGPELAFDEIPGLGPQGHTQSICHVDHAAHAKDAFEKLAAGYARLHCEQAEFVQQLRINIAHERILGHGVVGLQQELGGGAIARPCAANADARRG